MTFQLYTGPPALSPGDPAYLEIQQLQAKVDALSPTDQNNCEALLESWGWKPTINPSPMIRLILRALNAVGP